MDMSEVGIVAKSARRHVRINRQREAMREALLRLALDHWLDWLLTHYAPRRQGHRPDGLAGVFEAMGVPRSRSNTEHSDPTLGRVLRDERAGWDWPASIHAIIAEMTRDHQAVIVGMALGCTQQRIGEFIGMRQQLVSVMSSLVRERFTDRVLLLARTDAFCRASLGYSAGRFASAVNPG